MLNSKQINEYNVLNNVENISEKSSFFVEKAYYEEINYDKEYKYYVYGEAYSNDLKKVNSYMYGNYRVKKLCNTIEARDIIVETVNSLVKNIISSLNRIHIDGDVKEILSAYIDGICMSNDFLKSARY